MLKIKTIHKQYEGKPLLKGVGFEVGITETVCLLGQSGGGKSTILRIIAGLEEPESGQVLWKGQDLRNVPAHERHFGLMFQDFALFPHLNVFENVAFGLRIQKLDAAQINARVEEVLGLVGLGAFTDRSVIDLSGGEKQRVAFARAIAPQPQLLMLDEPMGALDRALRDQLLHELQDLLQVTDIPVIYVTHDQEEAFAIADRIMILHDGIIGQSGAPQDVYACPRSVWIAKFLGQNNILTGSPVPKNPKFIKTPIGSLQLPFALAGINEQDRIEILVKDAIIQEEMDTGDNSFTGVIDTNRFQGAGFHIQVRFPDGTLLSFNTESEFKIGQLVRVTIPPDAMLCYVNGSLNENCQK